MIASGLGITAATVGQAKIIENALSGVSAIPVIDAERVPMSLVGRKDRLNPLIEELRAVARQVSEQLEPEMKDRGLAALRRGPAEPAGAGRGDVGPDRVLLGCAGGLLAHPRVLDQRTVERGGFIGYRCSPERS